MEKCKNSSRHLRHCGEYPHEVWTRSPVLTQPTDNVDCIQDKTHSFFRPINSYLADNRVFATNLKILFNYMIDLNLGAFVIHW